MKLRPRMLTSDHPTYKKLEKVKKLMEELNISFKFINSEIKVIDNNVFGITQEFFLINGEESLAPFSNSEYFPDYEFKLKP